MRRLAELVLYYAARAQHVGERLRPALAEGRLVICDRYADSSIAYQGYGRGLPLQVILGVTETATGGLKPDLTFLLDVPVEVGLSRVRHRGEGRDRMEAEEVAFHDRVRRGYLSLLAEEPDRWLKVDALEPPELLAERLAGAVRSRGLAR
jgi:dTMP kinase